MGLCKIKASISGVNVIYIQLVSLTLLFLSLGLVLGLDLVNYSKYVG